MKEIILSLMLLLFTQPVFADELSDSLKGYCEKLKQCTKAQMSAQDMQSMPAGTLQMMEQSLDYLFLDMVDNYDRAVKNHDLYQPALACYQSLEKQSCDTMQNETAECKRFAKLAEKYNH